MITVTINSSNDAIALAVGPLGGYSKAANELNGTSKKHISTFRRVEASLLGQSCREGGGGGARVRVCVCCACVGGQVCARACVCVYVCTCEYGYVCICVCVCVRARAFVQIRREGAYGCIRVNL